MKITYYLNEKLLKLSFKEKSKKKEKKRATFSHVRPCPLPPQSPLGLVALGLPSAPLKVLFSNKSLSFGSSKIAPQEGAEQ